MALVRMLFKVIKIVLMIIFWPITIIVWIMKPGPSKIREADPEEARRFFEGE